jgi:trimeric autotransporter adhesin
MKKYFIATTILLSAIIQLHAQSVGIGTSTPNPSAKLDIVDTTKGMLMPRLTKQQRNAIANPALGLMVFNISDSSIYYFNGAWQRLPHENEVWRLKGNEINNTEFLGSTILQNINFRSGNDAAGAILPFSGTTSWGHKALNGSSSSLFNTAIGSNVLEVNSTGQTNVGLGKDALVRNIGGSGNLAIGYATLQSNTFGNTNIAIGTQSASGITTGVGNVFIGSFSTSSDTALSNSIAIGTSAVVNANNKIRLGNSTITAIEGQVPFTTPSDGRFKTNIKENVSGLDFIMQLRPVTYLFNTKQFDDFLHKGIKKDETAVAKIDYSESQNIVHTGFIAQEVEQATNKVGFKFDGLLTPKNVNETYSLSYSQFVVPLVKAVQEQQQQIDLLKKQNELLINEIQSIKQKVKP